MRDVGERLRALRKGAGMTVRMVAEFTGGDVSPATVSRAERGGDMRAVHLIQLADLYGASLDDICGRWEHKADEVQA